MSETRNTKNTSGIFKQVLEFTASTNGTERKRRLRTQQFMKVPNGGPAAPILTFNMALKGLSAQVGDAVALQVLCPGEGLATALFWAGEAPVVIVLPENEGRSQVGKDSVHTHTQYE